MESLLQKDPALRPSSAQEVSDALGALEVCLPVLVDIEPDLIPSPPVPTRSTLLTPRARLFGQTPTATTSRRGLIAGIGIFAVIGILIAWFVLRPNPSPTGSVGSGGPPIRIGVLHSRTGTMAISERPVVDAVLLAVEEINAQGGLLGRPIQVVQQDGQSDESVFAREAEKLIQEDRVCAIFGCWTSASRKAVVPVVEKHEHLLIYPVQYEGMEQSPNVIYLGPVPNQQILPALRWIVGFEGKKRWFLVGSDYVFPRTANEIIKDQVAALNGEIVGEEYLRLGSDDVAHVVRRIRHFRRCEEDSRSPAGFNRQHH